MTGRPVPVSAQSARARSASALAQSASVLARPTPVIAAPMAGASTPALAAAVSDAGGLGFLAAGYLSATAMAAEVEEFRRLTDQPAAVNLFVPQPDRSAELAGPIASYFAALAPTAAKYGVIPGDPRHDEDDFPAKIDWLVAHPVEVVTFTFGPVPRDVVTRLAAVGTSIGFTVTGADEARLAAALGADFLVAQGFEAGGHRGTWRIIDVPNSDSAAMVARAVIEATGLLAVAAGGVSGAEEVRALLATGATSVAVGTLFVAAEESRAPDAYKDALTTGRFPEAKVTRAFSGRFGRALANDFVRTHDGAAPAAYPNLHQATRPIRVAAAAAGDPDGLALWSGSGGFAARRAPAAEVLAALHP